MRTIFPLMLFFALSCNHAPQVATEIKVQGSEASTEGMVAKIGNVTLTTEMLRARMSLQGGTERYRDAKELRLFVDQQVRFELLAQEAMRQGLDRDPEVQEAARRAMVDKLIDRQLTSPNAIGDEAVQREYDRNIGDYQQPERTQAAIIKVKTLAEAQGALQALQSGKSDAMTFAALRKHYGAEDMNRDLELKYWSEEELENAFGTELAKAIFAVAQMGELGPVVKATSGFYVFKLTGRRAAYHRPMADVAGIIRQKLARQSRNATFESYIDKLRSSTDVKIDEAALAKILPP